MRQVFSSPRLENVERVAAMLEAEGIEVRITNGRSYKGNVRANFSYRDSGDRPQPALWIIKSEDQPRARAMLREAGLMDSSRNAPDSFLAVSFRGADPYAATPAQRRSFRYKVGLLLVITVILAMALMHGAKLESTAPGPGAPVPVAAPATAARTAEAPTAAAVAPAAAVVVDADTADAAVAPDPVVATPPALAERVFAAVLPAEGDRVACLALDGKDAPATLLARVGATAGRVVPASACVLPQAAGTSSRDRASGRPAVFIEVGAFRPRSGDALGTATIARSVYGHGRAPVIETLSLQRDGDDWRIVRDAAP